MKRYIFVLTVLLFSIGAYAQPKMSFAKVRQDFGAMNEADGKKEMVFEFKNTGDSALVITKVQPSCGCTASDWTKYPVPPQGSGFVKAVFDPHGQSGHITKSVSVFSNSKPGVVVLVFEGEVKPREKTIEELYTFVVGPLRFESNHLAFTRITKNEKKIRVMPFINTSKDPVTLDFEPTPPYISLKVSPATIKPGEKGIIEGTYDASLNKDAWGNVSDLARIKVNGVTQTNIYLYVSAEITEDFSLLSKEELANAPIFKLASNEVNFGKIKQGDVADVAFTFTNEGKRDLIIRHVKAGCGCTVATPEQSVIKPGESSVIKAQFKSAGYKGNIFKNVFVYTNDPQNSSVMLMIKGEVMADEQSTTK
ncbi:MAG TPA: DUF1573 domain-containing protein [Bacteroidales bacterium]|nr:DUF1573 domain-containing protein [Bacteroidales bacterium]HPT12624.1 DUF1573 domain-containing protein [Bacteroidales bacterium]